MRSLLITEEEKKTILGLYSKSPMNVNNTLYNEKSRIKKLMNINEGIDPSDLSKIPIFKKIYELIEISSEGAEKTLEKSRYLSQNIGEYSSKLRQQGIETIDDLLKKAREWQVINEKEWGSIADNLTLIDRYMREQKVFEEIETKLINDNLDEVISTTNKDLDELGSVLGLTDVEKEGLSGGVNLEGKSQAEIDEATVKLDTSKKNVSEALAEVRKSKAKLGAVDKNFRTPEQQKLLNALIEQEEKLQKYLDALEKQKKAFEKASEQLDDAKVRYDNTVNWQGKVFNPEKLSYAQRVWIKFSLDKLPEFFTLIFRFVSKVLSFQRVKLLQEELGEKMARLIELEKRVTLGMQSDELSKEMEYLSKEIDMLIKNLQGKDISFNYKGDKPTAYEYFVRFIKGGTGQMSTEVTDIWKSITGMLQNQVSSGKLTQDEANVILKRIKNAYTQYDDTGKPVAENLKGLFILRSDLDEISRESGYEKLPETVPKEGEIVVELTKRQTDVVSRIQRWLKEAIGSLGLTSEGWWGKFFEGAFKMVRNEMIFGLPLNLKYYLRPLAKGFNIKNIAILCGRLALTKAISTVILGSVGCMARWMLLMVTMGETGYTPQECEALAWRKWNEDMQKYRDMDLTTIAYDVVSINTSKEYDINKATATSTDEKEQERAKYASDVNEKYGPFRIKFYEIGQEIYSQFKALPTQDELLQYAKETAVRLKNKTTEYAKEKNKEYDKLFYALEEKTQEEMSGKKWAKILRNGNEYATLFTKDERDLFLSRTFYRNDFIGVVPGNIETNENIWRTYLDKSKYLPDTCVCKNKLTYKEEEIAGKICNIPQCDDYVRIRSRKPLLFSDKDKYDIPADGEEGFLIGNSAKSETNSYADWKPIAELTNYVK